MTDTSPADPPHVPVPRAPSMDGGAGAMIRAARLKQGLHIAALAASMKVPQAKLEALEAGRYDELPDRTFVRVLALAVSRALKIDPAPVLAQLPGVELDALGSVDGGLNMPFRERPGRVVPADWAPWRHPVLWLAALLLVAAAAFVLMPAAPLRDLGLPAAADSTAMPVMPPGDALAGDAARPADAASVPGITAPEPLPAASSAGPSALPSAAAPSMPTPLPAAAGEGDAVVVRALEATWVQIVDGQGQTLIARMVPAGETVSLSAAPPVRLRIGNARGTELRFRGQPVPLTTRDNVANLTLP